MKIIKSNLITKDLGNIISKIKYQRIGYVGGLALYPTLYFLTDIYLFIPQTFFCASIHLICTHLLKKQMYPILKKHSDFYNYTNYNVNFYGNIVFDSSRFFGVKIKKDIKNNNHVVPINKHFDNHTLNYYNMTDNLQSYIDDILYYRNIKTRSFLILAIVPSTFYHIYSYLISANLEYNFVINIIAIILATSSNLILDNNSGIHKNILSVLKHSYISNNHKYVYIDIIGNIIFKDKRNFWHFRKNIL